MVTCAVAKPMDFTTRDAGLPLPQAFDRLYRVWFACGVPVFTAVLGILWLMINRPAIG